MTEKAMRTEVDMTVDFNAQKEQARKARLLEILLEENVSENTAEVCGLLNEYREQRQLRVS